MMVRLILFALSLATSPTLAEDYQPMAIDLLRQSDAGMIHTAVRCKSDCQILQTLEGVKIFSATVGREPIQKLIDETLKNAPQREVSSVKAPLPRESKSPMHWRFIDGSKITQGGFTVHNLNEATERLRMPLYQAVLQTEQWLDRRLSRQTK